MPNPRRQLRRVALGLLLGMALVSAARAQEPYADPFRFVKWPAQDARAMAEGFSASRLLYAAGVGGVLIVVAHRDEAVTRELTDYTPPGGALAVRFVEELGNVKTVRPAAFMVFVSSLMTDNRRFQDAAFTSFEAIVFSNLVTNSLKGVFGRARPFQQEGSLHFRPFSGNTSFPSGHATTAFAAFVPWLLYYPNAFTPGLIVLGVGTGFSRILTDNHWFTDVVVGSLIGFTTAYALTRWHQGRYGRVVLEPALGLDRVGVTMHVRLDR